MSKRGGKPEKTWFKGRKNKKAPMVVGLKVEKTEKAPMVLG